MAKADTPSSSKPYHFYLTLWNSKNQALLSAREVLYDYIQNDSTQNRFFQGSNQGERRHVAEVASIVHKIDEGHIKSAAELMEVLNQIKVDNPEGPFAKCRQFIEERFLMGKYLPPTYRPLDEASVDSTHGM